MLVTRFHKKGDAAKRYGESWEISGVQENQSVVCNGFLAGNNLEELIEVYMGDLTGDSVYEKFGNEFPLLIKIIEARDDLSVQVHPDDATALERHQAYGKTEMWYIVDCEPGARIISGFKRPLKKEEYEEALSAGKIESILNSELANPGDVFFTPSGRIHAIGAGNLLIEIQQTSDITYRIFDWNRLGTDGKPRELHNDLAVDAIDYNQWGNNKKSTAPVKNITENISDCKYFTVNILHFDEATEKDYNHLDSFIIYICIEGEFSISWEGNSEHALSGETVLLPATLREVLLTPSPEARILEIFIKDADEEKLK
jgi:mannose-6-phosphate isomerase